MRVNKVTYIFKTLEFSKKFVNFKFIVQFILLLATINTTATAQVLRQPANSWVQGSNWYCVNGYQKSGNECVSIFAGSAALEPTNRNVAPPTKNSLNPVVPSCAENGSCYGDVSPLTGRQKTVPVQGYYRKDGTYVRGHYRSK